VDEMHAVHAELSGRKVLGNLLLIAEAIVATAHSMTPPNFKLAFMSLTRLRI
jgi:hypothetical protein